MQPSTPDLGAVLQAIKEDQPWSAESLLPAVYAELHRMAEIELARLPPGQSIGPTDLLHEALVRMVEAKHGTLQSKRHFFFLAARTMRDVLVERERRRSAQKRGGSWQRADVDADAIANEQSASGLFSLAEALEQLERDDPEARRIVELRFFAGKSEKEVAAELGVSLRTVERAWSLIRSKLQRALSG